MKLRRVAIHVWGKMMAELELVEMELYKGYHPLLLLEGQYEVLKVSHYSCFERVVDEEGLIWDCGDGNIIIELLTADALQTRLNGPNIWYRELNAPLAQGGAKTPTSAGKLNSCVH